MLRIVHLITGLGTGGAEMMLYRLLSRMVHDRFAPTVISLSDEATLIERFEALGISVQVIGMKPGKPSFTSIRKLIRAVRNLKPDMIQGWMYHGNMAALLSAACSSYKLPVIWNVRQSLYSLEYEKKGTAAIIRAGCYLSKYPQRIIYNSKTSAEQHEKIGYLRAKRALIPNGFETDIFKPSMDARAAVRKELNIQNDSPVVGLIGRYHPMKDHANFIQAAAIQTKRHPSTHFIMAGAQVNENNRTLLRHIGDFNLQSRFHLLGERTDISSITAALDIASSSSYTEGFPNVVGEAMACGVPCVITDVGDSAWIVGDTGKVVPPRNAEALAKACIELIDMGAERRMILGNHARQRILENFSIEAIVRRYEQLYLDVIDKENFPKCVV